MTGGTRWRTWRAIPALVGLVALAMAGAAGCSSGGGSDSSASKADRGVSEAQPGAPAAKNPAAGSGQGPAMVESGGRDLSKVAPSAAPGSPGTGLVGAQRQIIYMGTMVVRVDDVAAAASEVVAQTLTLGGFVAADKRGESSGHATVSLTLRVPAEKFSSFVDWLGERGTQVSRDLSTEDVTKQLQDLDARILTGRASVERVRALLAKAQNLSEITSIEAELARREGDLESLQAQKNNLSQLAALSTVTLRLIGKDAPAPKVAKKDTGFLPGLKAGWSAFRSFFGVLLTVLGALLPFLLAGAVVAVPVWWLLRRRGAARP